MIAPRGAASHGRALYRIGSSPNPLAWPPHRHVGQGRFDDPQKRFSALYAAEERLTCFVETLAQFRPALQASAAEADVAGTDAGIVAPKVPDDWYDARRLGRFRLRPGQRWLDLRVFETREALRGRFAAELRNLGLPDLDVGTVLTHRRDVTQALARWAYDSGYRGIAYASRFDTSFNCWAVFEGAEFDPILPFERIARDDPDVRTTAALFGLTL